MAENRTKKTSSKSPLAFISYSTSDKKYGAAVQEALTALGVDSFLAHNDIHVSEKWEKRILRELGKCNIFIPLLSKNFRSSDWCAQEIGVIVKRRGIVISPLVLDGTIPFGFVRGFHGEKVKKLGSINEKLFLQILADKFPRHIFPRLVKRLRGAYSFRDAEALVQPLRKYFREFNIKEANQFAEECAANRQIWDANLCRDEYLPEFLKVQGKNLKLTIKKKLRRRLEEARL